MANTMVNSRVTVQGNQLPYELDVPGLDPKVIEEKIESVRKEFEEKFGEKEKKYKEEIAKEKGEKENIKKMLEDIRNKQKTLGGGVGTVGAGVGGVGSSPGTVLGGGSSSGGSTGSNIFCTNCGDKDHKHEMKLVGDDTLVCTGPDCGHKKVLVDLESDYVCRDCGLPHLKIDVADEKLIKDKRCPFCGGKKMDRKDWKGVFDKIKTSRK